MTGHPDDMEIFLAELGELLDSVEENTVILERSPNDEALIAELFRAMHTVKGNAATLGLSEGVEVAHRMESVLDEVRAGDKKVTADLIDGLFSSLDWLRNWMGTLKGKVSSPQEQVEVTGGTGVLTVTFNPDAPLLSARCFQALQTAGEIVQVLGSVPSASQLESDEVYSSIKIFVSDRENLAEAVEALKGIQDVVGVTADGLSERKVGLGNRFVPGRTVRVDVELLDSLMDMVGELVIDRTRLTQIAARLSAGKDSTGLGNEISALASHLQRTSTELQEGIMRARLLPLGSIFSKFPRMIRDLAQKCGKEIRFEMAGETTELDRTVLEAIDDPLIHILRNAVDHGIESGEERRAKGKSPWGSVTLSAWHEENQVVIRVSDDGAGLDPEKLRKAAVSRGLVTSQQASALSDHEALNLVLAPGFSTVKTPTEMSGRGVGLDVVRANLERVNGQFEIAGAPGRGTDITMRLPLTLAIMRALLVRCGSSVYAVSTSSVEEVFSSQDFSLHTVNGKKVVNIRGKTVPFAALEAALYGTCEDPSRCNYGLLTAGGDRARALGVDELLGEEEIVVKSMGVLLSRLKGISGATILANGDPAVILDLPRII